MSISNKLEICNLQKQPSNQLPGVVKYPFTHVCLTQCEMHLKSQIAEPDVDNIWQGFVVAGWCDLSHPEFTIITQPVCVGK